ncbi:hypothetical protein D3C72_2048080 [compost metagenome]
MVVDVLPDALDPVPGALVFAPPCPGRRAAGVVHPAVAVLAALPDQRDGLAVHELDLVVDLQVAPAVGIDLVAVLAHEHIVVTALGVFAAR